MSPLTRTACVAIAGILAGAGPQQSRDPVPIFDGRTLDGWDGDTTFWRAESGMIVGESTTERPVTQNTFLIWRGGTTADFELTLEYRLSANANSGVQYRSVAVPEAGRWVLKGYQADLDGADRYSGQIYEERGRGFLARRGVSARAAPASAGGITSTGSLGGDAELKALLTPGDWNALRIVARGNTIVQSVNGRVMSTLIDDDEQLRVMEGLLGLQIHTGPPMRIEFRNLQFRRL